MPHQDRALLSERVDEAHHVASEGGHIVGGDRVRLVALAVASDVRCHDPEPGVGNRPDLMPPRVPELGGPVHQDHERSGPVGGTAKGDAVGLDPLEVE